MPRIALTATADDLTRREIIDRLGLADAPSQLKAFIDERHAGDAGIVYCLSRA